MKITFDLADLDEPWQEFKTQDEWNNYEYSEWYARNRWREGTYQPRAFTEPHKFPCIALLGPCLLNPDGADHQMFFFIYDYQVQEMA